MMATAAPNKAGLAHIKRDPEDFRVAEELNLDWSDAGEHAYFYVEKVSRNTDDVARDAAQAFGLAELAVGYAGRKDKHAVTRQWFSVATPQIDWPQHISGTRCLDVRRHHRKLRRGELACNRFQITLRDTHGCDRCDLMSLNAGFPNRFGPQRVADDNVARAQQWLANRRRRGSDVKQRGWSLSVLRSFLFNIVLDARIARGDHGVAIDGDVVDCGVPTGPLWGRGRSATRGEALEVEQAALRPWAGLCEGLEFAGLRQARRRLIERPDGLRVEQTGEGDWMLQFSLPPGSYATTMLESVLNLIDDSAARGAI